MGRQYKENWKRLTNQILPKTVPTALEDKDVVRVEDLAPGGALNNVSGPTSSINDSIARFVGVSGEIITDSLVIIDDSGNLSVEGNTLISGDLTVLGNTNLSGLINIGPTIFNVSSGISPTINIANSSYFTAVSSGTTDINMPPNPVTGQEHVIKDISGTAGTTPITINGSGNTIDGTATQQIATNYGAMKLILGPLEWNII